MKGNILDYRRVKVRDSLQLPYGAIKTNILQFAATHHR